MNREYSKEAMLTVSEERSLELRKKRCVLFLAPKSWNVPVRRRNYFYHFTELRMDCGARYFKFKWNKRVEIITVALTRLQLAEKIESYLLLAPLIFLPTKNEVYEHTVLALSVAITPVWVNVAYLEKVIKFVKLAFFMWAYDRPEVQKKMDAIGCHSWKREGPKVL